MSATSGKDILRLSELVLLKLDGKISAEDLSILNNLLESNSQAQQMYLDLINICSGLSSHSTAGEINYYDQALDEVGAGDFDLNYWQQLAEEERNAPAVDVEPKIVQAEKTPVRKTQVHRQPAQINKLSLYTAIISAAALVFIIVFVSFAPPASQEVATISDSIDAEWSLNAPIKDGVRISDHSKPVRLNKGIIKLLTDDNVEVILEAPSEFKFVSYSEVALNYGKLFARVSEQGLGFSVSTPNSKIVDLGTEFGVLCQINGDTEVYMYKGLANLFAGEKQGNKTSEMLEAGAARKVDFKESKSLSIPMDNDVFVRKVNSKAKMVWKGRPLSLADIVGGGDGFKGGIIGRGIEVTTGNVIGAVLNDSTVSGPKGYVIVDDNPYVDGVFVPGITGSTTQVASDGTLVSDMPETSGALWGYIFNGAMHKGTTTAEHSLTLDGKVMGTKENPAVTIHSNQGITFDLAKIRKTVPDLQIRSFDSIIGISGTAADAIENEHGQSFDETSDLKKVFDRHYSKAEFWVFVDGKLKSYNELTSDSDPVRISVPVTVSDRFLTLAVTESDDSHGYDWTMFGRPELVLDSKK